MPVVVLDTNIVWIMGGHPGWVDESGERESDPQFLRLPGWYQKEISALSAVNLAIHRLHTTAFVPPRQVIIEIVRASGTRQAAYDSLRGWGGEILAWAQRWFWHELSPDQARTIRQDWSESEALNLSFLPHEGDRAVARVAYALRSWHSRVLTIDKKSFWGQRHRLAEMAVLVQLPSELWGEVAPQL